MIAGEIGGAQALALDQGRAVDRGLEAEHQIAVELPIVAGVRAEDHALRVMLERAGAVHARGRREIIGAVIVAIAVAGLAAEIEAGPVGRIRPSEEPGRP